MGSKLSFYIGGAPEPAIPDMQRGAMKVAKVNYDSPESLLLLKQTVPVILYRKEIDENYTDISPAAFAALIPDKIIRPDLDLLIAGINEPVISTIAQAQALNQWYVDYAAIMKGRGAKVAAFSFSTGNPPLNLVPYLADACRACAVIEFHEYVKPQGNQFDQIGRYKDFLNALPADARKQAFIGETGFDAGGSKDDGWAKQGVSKAQYLEMLSAIDDVYRVDDYVMGSTIFMYGGDWRSFDVTPISKEISLISVAHGGGYLPAMPIVTPPIPQPVAKLTDVQLAQLVTAPQKFANPEIAISIILAESEGIPSRTNTQGNTPPSTDRGLWMFNSFYHPEVSDACAFDPICSTQQAFRVTKGGTDYHEWSSYKAGTYLQYLPRAKAALAIVTPPITTPTVEFTLTPSQVQVGQPVTLTYRADNVTAAYLDGQGLAPAVGSKTYIPTHAGTETHTLHVIFKDGTLKDYAQNLTVTAIPPIVVTPPSNPISTSPTNEHLKNFPRPENDNGRGLHFVLDATKDNLDKFIPIMKAMQLKWSCVYGGNELVVVDAAKRLMDEAGIMSVLRIQANMSLPHKPPDWAGYVKYALKKGVTPLFQIFNEPGDSREGYGDAQKYADAWGVRAQAVVDAGGFCGAQFLSIDSCQALCANMSATIKEKFFFSLHNYSANHSPLYPRDPINQLGTPATPEEYLAGQFILPLDELNALRKVKANPGATIYTDDTSVLRFLTIGKWFKDALGWTPPMLGSEGGWLFQNNDDARYPRVHIGDWIEWHWQIYESFRTGLLPDGTPLPDYVFSFVPWILNSPAWQSDSWIDGFQSTPTQQMPGESTTLFKQTLIDRLAASPSYVRNFTGKVD